MRIEVRRKNGNELFAVLQGDAAKKALPLITNEPKISYGVDTKKYITYDVDHMVLLALGGVTLWLSRGDYFKIYAEEPVSKVMETN